MTGTQELVFQVSWLWDQSWHWLLDTQSVLAMHERMANMRTPAVGNW